METANHHSFVAEMLESRRLLSAGNLDTSFGTAGSLSLGFAGGPVELLAAGSDQTIVVSSTGQLQRRNEDGSLDTTFGTNGVATPPVTSVTDAQVISGGKIMVSGTGNSGGVLCRLNADGTLDSTFGTNGVTSVSAALFAVQPSGQILVFPEGALQFYRLSANGIVNPFAIDLPTGPSEFGTVAVQSDGKVLLGGTAINADDNSDITLLRLNTDGSLDTSFANQGFYAATQVQGIALQSDGKIITASDDSGTLTVARLTSSGTIDSTFGNTVVNGVHETQIGFSTTGEGQSRVLIDSAGKIIVYDQSHLTRLNSNGKLDSTFGQVQTVAVYGKHDHGPQGPAMDGVALLSDGRMLVGGYDSETSANGQLYRLQSDSDAGGMFNLSGSTLSITGTDSNDWLQFQSGANLVIRVQDGFGRVYKSSDINLISASLGAGNDILNMTGWTGPTTVSGGDGNDSLIGGDGNDSISGNAGNDNIDGGAGNDRLDGNGGRDKIRGQDGNDRIYGGAGGDWLSGQAGKDKIWGEGGNDVITGNEGSDSMFGGDGDDTLVANDGEVDLVSGGNGTDSAMVDSIDQVDTVEQILS